MMRQLILTGDVQENGEIIRSVIAIEVADNSSVAIPRNAQTISETVYDLMWGFISLKNGIAESEINNNKIDFIEFGEQLAAQNNIEFRNQIIE